MINILTYKFTNSYIVLIISTSVSTLAVFFYPVIVVFSILDKLINVRYLKVITLRLFAYNQVYRRIL